MMIVYKSLCYSFGICIKLVWFVVIVLDVCKKINDVVYIFLIKWWIVVLIVEGLIIWKWCFFENSLSWLFFYYIFCFE